MCNKSNLIEPSKNVNIIHTAAYSKNGISLKDRDEVRVAAYCRVSTGYESQQASFTTQKSFYQTMISERPGWRLVGIYADKSLSGTSRIHRLEFNRMIADAKAGRIDYIVSKSISRFARNTVDTLCCIRELRNLSPCVGVYFEKENLDTLDASSELILTILSALAQEESRSISENIRWSIRKNFQAGIPHINPRQVFGYTQGEDGAWSIDPEKSKIVRLIFEKYTHGVSANKIAMELNQMGVVTQKGKKWRSDSILRILKNEKYIGDIEMQKTITKDFLTHKSVENHGEAPKYYAKDHHEAIVDRLTWNKAQSIQLGRPAKSVDNVKETRKKSRNASPFSNLYYSFATKDGFKEERLTRYTYSAVASNYKDERSIHKADNDANEYSEYYCYAYPVWKRRHNKTLQDDELAMDLSAYMLKPLHECALQQSFMEMLYWIKRDYETFKDQSQINRLFTQACENPWQEKSLNQGLLEKPISNSDIEKKDAQLTLSMMKENYAYFLSCLDSLPLQNAANQPLVVNGLDTSGSLLRDINGRAKKGKLADLNRSRTKMSDEKLLKQPDLLPFEKGIYCAFIEKGCVQGDTIIYKTNFGISLLCSGNHRTQGSFLGFKKSKSDGTAELIDETYKLYEASIQYRRKKKQQ